MAMQKKPTRQLAHTRHSVGGQIIPFAALLKFCVFGVAKLQPGVKYHKFERGDERIKN